MEHFSWIFDGIGTTIISGIVGLIIGGTAGYKIGVKKSISQKQKAGKNSSQIQIGTNNDSF